MKIRDSIQESLDKKKQITFYDILMSTMSNLNLSKRTAQEYVKLALFQLKIKKEDLK